MCGTPVLQVTMPEKRCQGCDTKRMRMVSRSSPIADSSGRSFSKARLEKGAGGFEEDFAGRGAVPEGERQWPGRRGLIHGGALML